MQTTSMHTDTLVNEYVHVVNQALGEHKDDAFFGRMLDLSEKVLDGKRIQMDVYGDDPSKAHDHFTLRFKDQRFELDWLKRRIADA